MKKQLYHYCSTETFISIIKNKALRFSDIMKSNDDKEIRFLWEKYYEYIEKTKGAVPSLKYEIKNQLARTVFLALCFTNKSDAIDMWTNYAPKGISIGFDVNILKELTEKIGCFYAFNKTDSNVEIKPELREVEYYNINNINTYVENKCKGIEFITDKFGDVFNKAPFCKRDDFASEDETRILLKVFFQDGSIDEHIVERKNTEDNREVNKGDDKDISSIKFEYVSNSRFSNVLTATVTFAKGIIECIKSITIGPDCELSKSDVTQLLLSHGFENCMPLISETRDRL